MCTALPLAPFDGPEYATHKVRKAVADAINLRIEQAMQLLESQEAFELLCRYDVPAAPVVHPAELSSQAHFASRGKFATGDDMPWVRFPVAMEGMGDTDLAGAPALGSAGG